MKDFVEYTAADFDQALLFGPGGIDNWFDKEKAAPPRDAWKENQEVITKLWQLPGLTQYSPKSLHQKM